MLIIIGCGEILLGILGILWAWERQQKLRYEYLIALKELFRKGRYGLVGRQQVCIDFFKGYTCEQREIMHACRELAQRLKGHEFAMGIEAWRYVWEGYVGGFYFTREEREVLLASGNAFFGKSLREVEELFRIYEEQFRELGKQCRCQYLEKRRLVFPMGMLSGLLLIIVLL